MSTDSDSQVKIAATIDATGASTGAEQVVKAVDKIEDSTKGAAKGFDKMVEEAGTMREAQRLSMGLFDVFEGGGRTIQGAAEMMRFFLLTAVDVNPVLLAASVIGAGLVAAFARAEGASKHAKDATKDDADEYAEAWKQAASEIAVAIEQVFTAQQKLTKQDEADLTAIEKKQALLDKQAKLDQTAAIERLRAQYIQDEQSPDLTDEQRKKLKDRFEAGKKDIEGQTTIHTSDMEREAKGKEYFNLLRTRGDQQQSVQSNQQMLDDLTKIQQGAREYIEGLGLIFKDGKITNAKGDNEVDRLQTEADKRKANLEDQEWILGMAKQEPGQYRDRNVADATRRVEAAQKYFDQAQKQVDDLKAAGQNYNSTDAIKKAQEDLDKSTDTLAKTVEKIPAALTEWNQASQAADQARAEALQEQQQRTAELAQQQRDENEKSARKQRDEELESRKTGVENDQLKAPPGDKGTFAKQLADLEVERLQNKLADTIHDNPKDLEAQTLLFLQMQKAATQGIVTAGKDDDDVTRKNTEAANKADEQQIAVYKQQIDKAGRPLPEAARQVLEDAMRKIEAMDKGNPAKELLDLMHLWVDRQNVINVGMADGIKELRSKIERRNHP